MKTGSRFRPSPGDLPTWIGAAATASALLLVHLQLYRVIANTQNAAYPQYVARNFTAASVLFAAFLVPLLVARLHVAVPRWSWMLVGVVSLLASVGPMVLHGLGWGEQATLLYEGQRVPQAGAIFVDLNVVLQSIWCTSLGFDVYQVGNGCIDPVIYGPGVLWFDWLPVDLRSISVLAAIGVAIAAASALAVGLIAKSSSGLGVIALLLCVLGAPWLLLLERGNLDALVIVGGVGAAVVATRWNRPWSWSLAAALIWILGTWKYYPFAMGVALLPVLRIKRGWLVLVGYALATAAFLAATWETFRSSAQGYEGLLSKDDYVVLGRIPVVARMIDATFPPEGYQVGDAFIVALCAIAVAWGVAFAIRVPFSSYRAPMMGVMGGGLFIAAIVVAGFGWAYKSTFLMLCIPILSLAASYRDRARAYASMVGIFCAVIGALVVWNTVLATLAGIIAASFALGASITLVLRRDPSLNASNPQVAPDDRAPARA